MAASSTHYDSLRNETVRRANVMQRSYVLYLNVRNGDYIRMESDRTPPNPQTWRAEETIQPTGELQ